MSKYLHGVYTKTADTETNEDNSVAFAQIVIGTAPVHTVEDPSVAVNAPILCESLTDCKNKLGYSTDFENYTLCQSMFTNFVLKNNAPVVFINVLDPAKHKKTAEEKTYTIKDNTITIADDVIVSSLAISKNTEKISAGSYITEWVNGKLVINFVDEQTGDVTIGYDVVDPSAVTKSDIIGAYNPKTDKRTGAELIKDVFPRCGVTPLLILAPGWTTDDEVGAVLMGKTEEINGCYYAAALLDLDTTKAKTRADAIKEKETRTMNENCIPLFPMIKKNGYTISYSAYLAAQIMEQAAATDGITCKSPSNKSMNIDDCVLADGTSVFYDQEDGNELNAAGIVTIIARNGWYSWGNNTAAYPGTTDPVKRWIMTRLAFMWIENDYVNTVTPKIDDDLKKDEIIDNATTDYNIKLSSWAATGRIIKGKISYTAADNNVNSITNGKFKVRTSLAANVPGETIENEFIFDLDALIEAVTGGAN
ncbi:MAG: hypothetical protein ACI4A5_10695 [Hominilimicola sp.]